MPDMILDGTGQGHRLKVLEDNSIPVTAVAKSEMVDTSEKTEKAFIFANGDFPSITTLNTETPILYVKNNSATEVLHIFSLRSCGTQVSKWRVRKNITGGTIISNQVEGLKNNLNISSSTECECTVYTGVDGDSFTGGSMFEHWINDVGHSIEDFQGAIILGPDDSLTLTVEVAVAAQVCCRMIGYYRDM